MKVAEKAEVGLFGKNCLFSSYRYDEILFRGYDCVLRRMVFLFLCISRPYNIV